MDARKWIRVSVSVEQKLLDRIVGRKVGQEKEGWVYFRKKFFHGKFFMFSLSKSLYQISIGFQLKILCKSILVKSKKRLTPTEYSKRMAKASFSKNLECITLFEIQSCTLSKPKNLQYNYGERAKKSLAPIARLRL